MLRVSFSPGRARACRHFGPPRENGGCAFRADPFLSPLAGYFIDLFHRNHRKIIKHVFFYNLFAPLAGDFC